MRCQHKPELVRQCWAYPECKQTGVCEHNRRIDNIAENTFKLGGNDVTMERLSDGKLVKPIEKAKEEPKPFVEPKTKWGLD